MTRDSGGSNGSPNNSSAENGTRPSGFGTVTVQYVLHRVGALGSFEGLCARIQQGFHDGGEVAGFSIPTVFGTVDCPAEGRGVKGVLGVFQRWVEPEQRLDHGEIAVPRGPVQWCAAMLTTCGHRQAGLEHQEQGWRVIVPRGMNNLYTKGGLFVTPSWK